MDGQVITTKSGLEHILLDRSKEAKPLSLSLLKSITKNFRHEIGRGGFAVVYKGYLGYREVAVKWLSQKCTDEKEFTREVDCLMKAKHKNIVRCLGYCSDTQGQMVKYDGRSVMADVRQRLLCFEYVPKGTLAEYIKDASREWGECYKIIKGVCEGLHYLHKEQIVHRDLKPANILLTNDIVPIITDFGISRCFGELKTDPPCQHQPTIQQCFSLETINQSVVSYQSAEQIDHFISNVVGTRGYLAPELLHKNGKITFKSDVYSLGIIILEILTGDKDCPQVEKVQKDWSHKLEESQKKLQLEQIRVCYEVAQTCLSDNPENRPSAQEIIDTLEETEREKRCIVLPGANSTNPRSSLAVLRRNFCKGDAAAAAATPLRSSVAASNMSEKKQPQPLREEYHILTGMSKEHTLSAQEKMARQMEMLKQVISKAYVGETLDLSMDVISRGVYDLVEKKGEELYSAVETTLASEVKRFCGLLDNDAALSDRMFLNNLLSKWNLHTLAVEFIECIFMYMDRTYVPINRKTPIKVLGLCLWRDEMARSKKIWPRLIEAVKRQKGDEDELVPDINKMLTVLGVDNIKYCTCMPQILCIRDST